MTSRKRKNFTKFLSKSVSGRKTGSSNTGSTKSGAFSRMRRRHLLETLESRQLLAGPQLIGVQPNEGDLIVDGSVRDTAPRVLTLRFDEDQVIKTTQVGNTATVEGIRITRAGADGNLGTGDDVTINPGLVTLADNASNEVVIRFADQLVDDKYRLEVFGFDDASRSIVGLRNEDEEFLVSRTPGERSEVVNFELKLGALIEAVVPQPVVRNADGSLTQNRNEIVVYFNEDPLFVEDDPTTGQPTSRSAENPRFYQLLLTQDTVRTTDDVIYNPTSVVYDQATHTARLFFAGDINNLPGVPLEGGTFRLRVGTAVDARTDLILPPSQVAVAAAAIDTFDREGFRIRFASKAIGEAGSGQRIRFERASTGPVTARVDTDGTIVFDLGNAGVSAIGLRNAVAANPAVAALIAITFEMDGVQNAGGGTVVPARVVGAPPIVLQAVGDTLGTALDVGIFGLDGNLRSFILSEEISPQPFAIELPGGNDDPGHRELPEVAGGGLIQHLNSLFGANGADITDGITEIDYNFKGIFATVGTDNFLNQINDRQKTRIREALNLWSSEIGVQFRETVDQGITFALGNVADLPPLLGTQRLNLPVLNASLRIDPTFVDSAIVFSNQASFNTAYGEDFLRKAMAGIGLLLGLEQTPELTSQTLLTLNNAFLNQSIDTLNDNEPVFPANYDVLHGQYLHRPDSIDVDMYRFEVNLGDADRVGTLTAETFAERLPDSSSLDTTLTLFQQQDASIVTDFNVGTDLSVRFDAIAPGKLGNNVRIDFFRSDRPTGDRTIRVTQPVDNSGNPIANGIVVDMPRRGTNVPTVPVADIVNAINNSPFASSIVKATIEKGNPGTDVSGPDLNYSPLLLEGGGLVQLSRNDDYFSEDSRIVAKLGAGVYYIGVAASGNNTYDPTIPGSGFGGLTQGQYDLNLKFEPQVDEIDVIRDLDSARVGVPGTPIDGDGDGTPGGVNNFWFQTRPLNRIINFVNDGAAVTPGQTMTIVGGTGVSRTYEFVPAGQSPRAGNAPVIYAPGPIGSTPATGLAAALASAINARSGETGVSATIGGAVLTLSGERGISLSNDFGAANAAGRTIFVDKTAGPNANGTLTRPFNNISNPAVPNAFGSTIPGDIVRIVGNGGVDNNIATEADNFAYKIGVSDTGGITLEDGRTMDVPKGVTTMIDAAAVFKLRGALIGVGSSTLLEDRSGGALQVLGTPRLVQLSPQNAAVTTTPIASTNAVSPLFSDGSVIFTSTKDRNADSSTAQPQQVPAPGDWGGLVFRRDVDQSEGRLDLEDEGIFLQHVNHAQIRYGGSSNLLIDSIQQLVNPIQIFNLRPTVTFNEISFSADAAISASPDSFEETSFQQPRFQQGGAFTSDYARVGPAINNNLFLNNSINGLFIRVVTTPGTPPRALTLAGRLDDIGVVHYVPENILIQGTPGGSIQDGVKPDLVSTSFITVSGGTLAAGTYDYRMTFVDAGGFESLPSDPSGQVTVGANSTVRLLNLPPVLSASDYVSRRLYRRDLVTGQYRLIANLDATSANYVDNGRTTQGVLDLTRAGIRGRLDASLVVDPGTVIKFRGARLELGQSAQLLAEGLPSNPVIFTSFADDRFGAGGTFDTNNDNNSPAGVTLPARADWSGIYAAATASVSLDFATVAYGGGVSLIDGGQSRGFAALELQQADGRVTNSRFEFNEDGQDGAGPVGRFGRLGVTQATIFVRGSQPTIVGNTFVDNRGTIIDIDSDSMTAERRVDLGRQTGDIDRFSTLDDNYGPLVRLNRYDIVPTDTVNNRQITGLEIRGGLLTTESVWDDTDIVHLLFDSVEVGNFHSQGGLRLISRPEESLVVKLTGAGSPFSPSSGTGLSATGSLTDIEDRIGGSVQIIGLPGAPVVLTSFADDTVGAGLKPDGSQFTDNNGDSFGSRPEANDWRSILFDQYSNDRNFDYILEQTLTAENAPGLNGSISNAQVLGELAPNVFSSDEQFRLGFEVEGFLSEEVDVDNFSFTAEAGTRIWLDVDRTNFNLDTVIEVLDANGNVIARSDNSFDEVAGAPLEDVDTLIAATTRSLQGGNTAYTEFGAGGLYEDFGSTNPRDAGLSLTLPGNPGVRSVFFFRVRSDSVNPDDRGGGLTKGGYRFQLRLREEQEFPGNIVRFADVRYAQHGIHVRGAQGTSPLLGEAQENEVIDPFASNNDALETNPNAPGNRAQYIGNLLVSEDKVFSVGGAFSTANDTDFYQIDVYGNASGNLATTSVFDVDYAAGFSRPDTTLYVFYDPDGEQGPEQPRLILMGEDSSILDDQAKPVTSSSIDLLTRGSVNAGDPFVGPISLTEGSYFVAVVGDGRIADALTNPTTRREPLESILRIFEDRLDTIGGATALPPRETELFDRTTLEPGWTVTTQRGTTPGHGFGDTFNGSSNTSLFPPSVQFEAPNLGGTFATSQDLDLGDPLWSLADDPDIGNRSFNTSQFIPHTTVFGTTPNEIVDIYQFTVPVDGAQVILDIDNGANPFQFDNTVLPTNVVFPSRTDPDSVDLKMFLFDATFNQIGFSSNSLVNDGAQGSLPSFTFNNFNSSFTDDPYIQPFPTFFTAGTYYVAVAPEATTYDPASLSFNLDPADRPTSGTYTLHVSVEGHANDGGNPGNQSLRFDRSTPVGTITSNPFDLTGYGPNDQPRFYFSYLYDPAGLDNVVVRATSDQNPLGSILSDAILSPVTSVDSFSQAIASLAEFAGHTNIVLEFEYTVDEFAFGTAEGLYLDDFIVGFAERGEMVLGAARGVTGISGAASSLSVPGEYQLEVRPATPYATPNAFGLQLDTTFDTNTRQQEAITIVAPFADQLVDGDTFTLSDGVRTMRFEFDDTTLSQNPRVVPGNVRIPFSAASTQTEIAGAIRAAINLPVVQNTIRIQASDSTGSATEDRGDVTVAIAGLVLGDFLEVSATMPLPASGTPLHAVDEPFRLPVIFNRGFGDENVERAQGQIIVEQNTISHVNAIGIYSEPGDRGTDPEDIQGSSASSPETQIHIGPQSTSNPFLNRAPIGSTNPGAVRNLPTLNGQADAFDPIGVDTAKNLLIGGLAPGITIRNNTIDQAQMAGIKVDGDIRPFVFESSIDSLAALTFGDSINDGLTFVIDAADLRVVFEFEELNGAPVPAGGSGVLGGDGVVDGHVPVYYHRTVPPPGYLGHNQGSTRHEVMLAIYDAIQSSILVTNGMAPLVEATLGTSLRDGNVFFSSINFGNLTTPNASVYVEGATNIVFSSTFQKVGGGNPFSPQLAPVHNAPQPVPRIVNNTIYGEDGNAAEFSGNPLTEPNDLLSQAIDVGVGNAHTGNANGAFVKTGNIGDSVGLGAPGADVDMYRVHLGAGDRLVVDIDTLAANPANNILEGPDTVLRIFDSSGTEVVINNSGQAPDHLETAAPANFDSATARNLDPFIDFTATEEGTYYIGVSSAGNDTYDARSISGRKVGTGGTGNYSLAVEVYAPRSFVLSINSGGSINGIDPLTLVGDTFTITQIPDFISGGGFPVRTDNTQVFQFYDAGVNNQQIVFFNRNGDFVVEVPVNASSRLPDIQRIIAFAIDATYNNLGGRPVLGNQAFGNGPDGLSGPIQPVTATALGGIEGTGAGLRLFPTAGALIPHNTIFGHNHTSTGNGVLEQYVLIERAAKMTISPEASAAGLRLDPVNGVSIDQLYPETGVLLTGGTSGTVVNNVFSNLHQGLVDEITKTGGFFQNNLDNVHPKPHNTIVTANVFQHIEPANNVFRQGMHQPFTGGGDIGITPGPSNVNGGTDDFNVTLANNDPLFVHAEGSNFLPRLNSVVIDSSVNSLTERDPLVDLRQAIGIPVSNVLAPNRDVNGVLRADNPDVAPPGGLGSQVFKDRGSNELADFVGPVAIIDVPRDNDPQGVDIDPATGFLRLNDGVYQEFRVQLRDTGDSSDPFAGLGIDDDTVLVAPIDGLRKPGANITLFENDRLLEEGIDYRFAYDATRNIVTFTPLAGIFQNDRSYRIALNNRNRTVLVAPQADQLRDGDQLSVTDANGGTVVFEFESGFELQFPETLTLVVPTVGTDAGGVRDGEVFQIDDGVNAAVIFEFDRDGVTLPNSTPVSLPVTATPRDPAALQTYLAQIATNIAAAINGVPDSRLNVDAVATGTRVVVGAEAGTVIDTSNTGLLQDARTRAIRIPVAGTGPGGALDGQTFTVNNGAISQTFELDTNNALVGATNNPVPLNGVLTGNEVAIEISRAIAVSGLNLSARVLGNIVYLNLPDSGSLVVAPGQATAVGVSRTPVDGDIITVTPLGGTPITFEINRTDGIDTTVMQQNLPLNITRLTTANQLATLLANQLTTRVVTGIDPDVVAPVPGGRLSIGGEAGLQISVTAGSSIEVLGSPAATGPSTISVFGSLFLTLPSTGGFGVSDGSVLILVDNFGNQVPLEFNEIGTPPSVPGAVLVPYNQFDDDVVLATALTTAINGANLGIAATQVQDVTGALVGRVDLGRIDDSRVITTGIPADPLAIPPVVGAPGAFQITTRRGIVNDGEVLIIRQGATEVRFEFESTNSGGGVAQGNVAVSFQPGSTPANVATTLAAAINNNKGGLTLNAVPETDAAGALTGRVILNDIPGTAVDVSQAPTLGLSGVPGGAIPVPFTPAFTPEQIKQSLLLAINSVNPPGQAPVSPLVAADRGGATFFIENGEIFTGPLVNFFLPAIADIAGNPLEPNRQDQSTTFTILMPTVPLDFGDAPDPVGSILGRYPTRFLSDGPRHVVTTDLMLGSSVDIDADGQPSRGADADDNTIFASTTGTLFNVSVVAGKVEIVINPNVAAPGFLFSSVEGNTITISNSTGSATLEFDTDGVFDEDNFAIQPFDRTNVQEIAAAIRSAIAESPLIPASVVINPLTGVVTVSGDDEDGVILTSITNPAGNLNKNVSTPITVSVLGAGTLEAWIDYNVDGDFDDPNEKVISATTVGAVYSEIRDAQGRLIPVSRTFEITVPQIVPDPVAPTTTYARFRVSRDGGLRPTGLALSGEVEDYAIQIVPGAPPTISADRFNQTYLGNEDTPLRVVDPTQGILQGVVDPQGDLVRIVVQDTVPRNLMTPNGDDAGMLTVNVDGSFDFVPTPDFNGTVSFQVRVTDIKPGNPSAQLVNSQPINVTLTIAPVNDKPFVIPTGNPAVIVPVQIPLNIVEDQVVTLTPAQLFAGYAPGPTSEQNQLLVVQTARSLAGEFRSVLGGTVRISDDSRSIEYTPPANIGGVQDSFTYTIADVPGAGQLSMIADLAATVVINIAAINDPPIANPDNFSTLEGTVLPFTAAQLLGNDLAGPSDEINAGQTISLGVETLPKPTTRGGQIRTDGSNFIYAPPAFFSGIDTFTYIVVDSAGATTTGTASVTVGAVNNAPEFIGVNGEVGRNTLTFDEAKPDPLRVNFNLTTWFRDPDGDSLNFSATSQNVAVVSTSVTGNQLELVLPPFQFGTTSITVTATDPTGLSIVQVIPITVNNTPDAPRVIMPNPLNSTTPPNTFSVLEDQLVVVDLREVFNDPDNEPLTYSVTRLGTVANPTAAQIAANPVVQSITFVGNQLQIVLDSNQSGSVDIEIAASDTPARRVSTAFSLVVINAEDVPDAVADSYNVAIGSQLSVLNPALGLLRNDTDDDGDTLTVDASTLTQPQFGSLTVNPDGTFIYDSLTGVQGGTDSFTYRVGDGTGRFSEQVTVTLNLSASRYQNPVGGLREDVSADGLTTAIDALLIINVLNRLLGPSESSLPVSQIGAPPPPYYDVDGNGVISAADALEVIRALREQDAFGEGEQVSNLVASSSTRTFAALSSNLPTRVFEVSSSSADDESTPDQSNAGLVGDARDLVLAAGFEIESPRIERGVESIVPVEHDRVADVDHDEALNSLFGELNLLGE